MTSRAQFIQARRHEAWEFGAVHREALVAEYMKANDLTERPFLKDIAYVLVEDIQRARVREEILPLDTFGQTEVVNGRIEVSINSRIPEMPLVKDAKGVAYTTLWHESVHIEQDINPKQSEGRSTQLPFAGFELEPVKLIVCRSTKEIDPEVTKREFFAENAATDAAISGDDLNRTRPFLEFQELAHDGGDLGGRGWRLLYRTAETIGVNITVLVRYLEQRNIVQVQEHKRLVANPLLFGGFDLP